MTYLFLARGRAYRRSPKVQIRGSDRALGVVHPLRPTEEACRGCSAWGRGLPAGGVQCIHPDLGCWGRAERRDPWVWGMVLCPLRVAAAAAEQAACKPSAPGV